MIEPHLDYYCRQCHSPRPDVECWKCHNPTIVPHPEWKNTRMPDVKRIREIAKAHGYALGVHGSLERDLDVIAAPWTDNAVSADELIDALCEDLEARVVGPREVKPLGRIAVSLQLLAGWYKLIDLSICPRACPP